MRRHLIAMVLAGAVGAGTYAAVGDDADTSAAAPVVSYPRSVAPLPVPEIVIGEQPWTDPLPTMPAPTPLRKGAGLPEGFARCVTDQLTQPQRQPPREPLPICPSD